MRNFRTRIVALGVGLSWLLLAPLGWAADHGDGWLDIVVLAGLDLIEGPPYPATPVEMDVALRRPGAASLPSGRLLLGLTAVEDSASGDFIAVTATAVDNAQLGEVGDFVVMDVYFVPASPPNDELPSLSRFEWLLASSTGTAGRQFEFSTTAPIVKLSPTEAQTSLTGDIYDDELTELPDYGRLDLDFGIHPGQALEFASLDASASGPGSQLRVVFDLRALASGSVDTGEPLFRVSITTEPLQALPTLPPVSIGGFAMILLALGLLVLTRFSKREGASQTSRFHRASRLATPFILLTVFSTDAQGAPDDPIATQSQALVVVGPVFVSASDLVLDGPPLPDDPGPLPAGAGDDFSGDLGDACLDGSCFSTLTGEPSLPGPPSPLVTAWDWPRSRQPLDPQVAAGKSHLLVSMIGEISLSTKGGQLVTQLKNNLPYRNPVTEGEFFEPLTALLNAGLNLAPSVASQLDGSGNLVFGINAYYDGRVIYDDRRDRYIVVALARNQNTKEDVADTVLEKTSRRTKVVLGISATDDPRDGWWLYAWDAVIGDGACYDNYICNCPGSEFIPGDSGDYPSVGISDDYLVVTTAVGNLNVPELACLPPGNNPRYALISMVDLDDLAAASPSPEGLQFWDFERPDSAGIASGIIQPAIHHDSSSGQGVANLLVSTDGAYSVIVWGISAISSGTANLFANRVPVSRFYSPSADSRQWYTPQGVGPGLTFVHTINMGNNLRNRVLKSVVHNGRLHATFHDCREWQGAPTSNCIVSIRLIRLDISQFPTNVPGSGGAHIDRTFGKRHVNDPAGAIRDYAWPAVDVNALGDMVLNYTRTGPGLYPEARFSVYIDGEADIRSSHVLHAGDYSLGAEYDDEAHSPGRLDLTGSAKDPVDQNGIWIVHPYAHRTDPMVAEGHYKLAVGKVFGVPRPEISGKLSSSLSSILPGGSFLVDVTVSNTGDGDAPSQTIQLVASLDPDFTDEIVLLAFVVPAISSSGEYQTQLEGYLPADAVPGEQFYLSLRLDVLNEADEYNEQDNLIDQGSATPILSVVALLPGIGPFGLALLAIALIGVAGFARRRRSA